MSAAERRLATAKTFLVAMTRTVDRAALVVDSAPRLEAAVTRNAGEKASALETMGAIAVERGVVGPSSDRARQRPTLEATAPAEEAARLGTIDSAPRA